jgi:AraC family transcriptional activator of pobA
MDQTDRNLDFSAPSAARRGGPAGDPRAGAEPIPSFFLYGEAPQSVGDRYLHLESLDDRSRASDWNIRPHAHANLNHIFYIGAGGGQMRAEAQALSFQAPCLLIVPARVVHGFAYELETAGSVLTVSEAYLQDLIGREPGFGPLLAEPAVVPIRGRQMIETSLTRLTRELAWTAPGHAAAVEALFVGLLVEALRMAHVDRHAPPPSHGHQAALVARFRELVEAHYRSDLGLDAYADRLAVSGKQLRSACLRVAHATPLRILQDRRLLEAKRLLLYSNMTVAEAGYYLGFSDAAYFSRFFTRGAGSSPRAFRDAAQAQAEEA